MKSITLPASVTGSDVEIVNGQFFFKLEFLQKILDDNFNVTYNKDSISVGDVVYKYPPTSEAPEGVNRKHTPSVNRWKREATIGKAFKDILKGQFVKTKFELDIKLPSIVL